VRLVNGDTHLAEDVTQTVFADLARLTRSLSREVMLGGWLHRHTCFVAGKIMRSERRRQARERQAAEQFKTLLTGDQAVKDAKGRQIYQLMQEETAAALAAAGLPADYQTTPTLNFRNIASAAVAEQNLKLLDDIYGRGAARLGSVLNASVLQQFQEFRASAISGNRMNLALNRQMMAPGGKGK